MKKNMPARLVVARNLRLIRSKQGLSQEKLAELANLHRTYISSVERGERNVTIDSMEKLAQALKIQLTELLILDETSS